MFRTLEGIEMPNYTLIITIYAISVTAIQWRQARRTSRHLLSLMAQSSNVETITGLATSAHCSKFRAWMFLVGLRAQGAGTKAEQLQEGDFVNIWGYRLTARGRSKYLFRI